MSLAPQSTQSLVVSTEVKAQGPLTLANPVSRSLLFIDSSVAGAETWMTQPGAYLLDPEGDAIAQISQVLAGLRDVASVQIVSHGRSGGLFLGQDWLDAAALQNRAGEIRAWQSSLTADADILLFGCEVAAGSLGRDFVGVLAQLSGADVAASDDLTGNGALGGDWDLEVETGKIGSVALFQAEQSDYEGVLNTTYHNLAAGDFSQNWNSPTTIINGNGDWASVPSIVGYEGGGLTSAVGIDPQTLLNGGSSNANVIANQTAIPLDTLVPGGIMEFNGFSNQTIALKASDAVSAPHLLLYMNATGQQNVRVSFTAKDIDNTATSNAITPIAVQYRIGNTGDFINLPDGALTDITAQSNDSSFIRSARLTVLLPKEASNQANIQIRIMTTNAVGVDEWVGIDDIKVTSTALAANTAPVGKADLYKLAVGGTLTTSPSVTALDFNSNLGNYVGQRETARYRTYDSSFIEFPTYANGIRIDIERLAESGDNWDVNAYPKTGDFLAPGIYNDAVRFASVTAPGFDFSGSGRGYNTSIGNFTVNQLLYGADNRVASWDVSFIDYRGDGDPLAESMSGRLRYRATADGNLPGILSNDSDTEGSALTANLVANVQNGTLIFNADGGFSYTPNAGFEGFDSFTYTASDSIANSTPTTVKLQVGTPGTVSITATDSTATEAAGNTGTYRITRTGNTSLPMEVNLSLAGTAAATDYSLTGNNLTQVGNTAKVTIAAGQTFVDVTLTAIDDLMAEGDETIALTVEDGLYFISTTKQATVTINRNDFVVTNTNASGEGSLAQAVSNASSIAGTETITFSGAVFTDATPDVITPSSLLILSSLNLIAPDGLTISGGNARQVILVGSGVTTTLQNVTIADGLTNSNGGGISNYGNLTLRNVVVKNNVANGNNNDGGAIYNQSSGTLTIENSTIENNTSGDDSGGIRNDGTLTIINSTISGNTATSASSVTSGGGGLLNIGIATITNSTFSGNKALNGGAIRNDGTLTLVNNTITQNTATGSVGGLLNTVNPTTFAVLGRTTLKNTIVAGNIDTTPTPQNIIDIAGGLNSFTDQGNNLLGAGDTLNSAIDPTTLAGTTATPLDPKLDVLASNGGRTKTHAILTGSQAINGGTDLGAPVGDQRGAGRNGTADIGAFEFNGVINAAPTAVALQNLVNIPDGQSTIVPFKVADIVITDDALGTNVITISGPDAARFIVSGTQLFLAPGGSVDFETKNQFNITLSVDDPTVGAAPDLAQNFVINVADVNEAPTAIALTNTVVLLPDSTNATTGIRVADIVITDDLLGTETFTLSGADSANFEVRLVAGLPVLFFTAASLNPVTKPSYAVTLSAKDLDLPFSTALTQNFSLTIQDVNDPPTNLVLQNPITTIAENTATAALKVATIAFTDDGTGTNAIAITGTDAGKFDLIGNELFLKAGTVLDFETQPSYAVTVTVDDATLGTTAELTQNFVLTVTNVNEAPTGLALANPVTTLLETANTVGGVKVADIAITDDALGDETLTITGSDAASFELRDGTGGKELFFIGTALNAVTKPSYSVSVSAIDSTIIGSTPLTQSFTLSITDVNSPPTGLVLQNAVNAINENASTATALKVADLAFTDDGTGTNTIAISGADAAKFDLVGNAIFLKAGTVLDFETQPSYAVTVTVDDATLGTAAELTENFVLSIRNINEAPTALALLNPVTSLVATTDTTGGVKVADITITDDALGDETVTVTGVDAASFEIRDVAGAKALFLIAPSLNAVTKPSYSVTVSAIDGAIVGSTAVTQPFTLAITNVNAAPTALTFQNAVASIAENTSITAAIKVADLVITDEGLGTNTIALGGADAAKFSVVGTGLFLNAGTVLDFETKSTYDVTVTVDDSTLGATPDLTQAFTLAVTNVNEAPTALALTNPLTSINETTNTTAGVKIADIAITDDALGDETFTLAGTDAASFVIRDVAGAKALFFIGTGLNAATKPTYAVTVEAVDATLAPSTKVSAGLTLTITGNNGAPTALLLNNRVISIAEDSNTFTRTKVADLAITDDGLGTNAITIGGTDAASFEVSGNALYLKAATALNFETKPSYSITVNVDDSTVGATPDLTQVFTLSVTDANEAPTALALTPTTLALAENTPTNIKVADITLTDDALGTERFILSGSDASSFEVRPVTGGQALFLTGNLDFESKPNYSVTVEAIDDTILGSNPISKTFTLSVTNQNDPTVGTVTINGNPAPGNTLTSSNTLFDQDVIRVYAYQWQSSTDGINFTDVTIANSASFSVTPSEAGKRLRLKLTTTDSLQTLTTTFSAPTGIIPNTPVPPIPNPNPTPIPTPAALSAISTVASQTIAQWLPNLTTANYPSGSSYVITSDRPDLFETPPTIAPNGTLTYAIKPGLEVNQTINLTIQVRRPDGTINPTNTVRSTLNLRFRAEALVRNTRTEELGLLYIDQVNQIQGAKPITLGSNFGAQAGTRVPLNAQWKVVDTKDFNRDGVADILFQNSTLDEMAIWMMNSNGQIMDGKWLTGADGQRLRTQNPNWKAVGFGDIDGDRNLDIIWHNQQSDEIAFWFLQSDGFSVKSYDYLRDSSGSILKTQNPAWQLSKLGDFDGDGDTDLLFRLPELNQTAIIRLQGKTFVDAQFLGTSPDSSLVIRGVGDYNGDRIADIYWQTPQNDRVVVQPLTFQAGRWVSESFITIASGGNRPLQGIADLDRNSTDDLLFLDPTNNGLLAKPVEQTNGAPTAIQQQGQTFAFNGADWSIVQTDEFGDFV
jgi:hypothetical protein